MELGEQVLEGVMRKTPLSKEQKELLERYVRVDDEWKATVAAADRYSGLWPRLAEALRLREKVLGEIRKDPVLEGALGDYERGVEEARLENEP